MVTLPAGDTGDWLLAKIPAPPIAESITIGVAPAPAARWPKDHRPCTISEPLATVVSDVVVDVTAAAAVFVTDASGWADCLTLDQEAASEIR